MTVLPRNTINYYVVTTTIAYGVATKVETASTFIGSVQPITGKDLESMSSGRTDVGMVKAYSDTKLNVSLEGVDHPGDIIVWQGQRWECVKESIYQNGLVPHYKYFCEYRGEVTP
jgi:hypothetical protein